MGSMQGFDIELRAAVHEYYRGESDHLNVEFDVLFKDVRKVLEHSTSVAESCLLGKSGVAFTESKLSVPSIINCSLYVLRQIHSMVVAFGEDSERDVADSIVKMLSPYSGAERAVLTLAAFALSYGELLVYVDPHQLTPLTRVDEIMRVQKEEQFKTTINELNDLTKQTIEFIGFILELDNLSKKDCVDDMSVVTKITDTVEHYSLSAVRVIVACMTLVNYPTYCRITTGRGLISSQASWLSDKLTKLRETIENYKLLIDEWETYSKLHTCICSRSGIINVMTCMMRPCDPFLEHKEKVVRVADVLKGKNVLLFISELDISEDDFSTLETIHKYLEKMHRDYKIVWIPVVGKWTRDEKRKFDTWKRKMPWYVVNYEKRERIVGINYIKKRWHFSYEPMVVVLSPRGAVECLDAMHMIRAWGEHAFPFSRIVPDLDHCKRPIIFDIIEEEVDEEEYVLLYGGGKDGTWINGFEENVTELKQSVSTTITLQSFAIGGNKKFWTRIESLLFVKMQRNLLDDATKQFQKLLSLKKDESGWAILCKGPNKVLACASGTMITNAVIDYKEWTEYIGKKKFESCLQEYFDNKYPERLPCHVPFPSFSPSLPVIVMKCPDCGERMERTVTYKCGHQKNNFKFENGYY